jgi:hypothetical protein
MIAFNYVVRTHGCESVADEFSYLGIQPFGTARGYYLVLYHFFHWVLVFVYGKYTNYFTISNGLFHLSLSELSEVNPDNGVLRTLVLNHYVQYGCVE